MSRFFPQSPSLAPTLQDLARARMRERRTRLALWSWCVAILAWLLPLGGWTATALPPVAALFVGLALSSITGVLVLLHRAVTNAESILTRPSRTRQAAGDAPHSGVMRHVLSLHRQLLTVVGVLAVAALLLLSGAVLDQASIPGFDAEVAWLLHPLAALLLTVRWRLRGAILGIAGSLLVLGLVEGWLDHLEDLRTDPASRSMIIAAVVLTTTYPLVVGTTLERVSRAIEGRGLTDEDLHAAARAKRLRPASNERLRSLLQNAADMVTILDADGVRRDLSPSVEQVLGYGIEELIDTSVFTQIHQDDVARVLAFYLETLKKPGVSAPVEFRCRDRKGVWRCLEATFNNLLADPQVGGVVMNARDITERKKFEEQLAHQAFHDPLTGLPNRALFTDRLSHALAAARRDESTVAVLFVDLDRFKLINDSLGHSAGDALLTGVARRLLSSLRPGDTAARFGGDEFVVLLEHVVHAADAMRIADRIIAALQEGFDLEGHEVFTAASIGVALSTSAHATQDDLLRDADVALYQAKDTGKGRAVLFEPRMNAQAVERLDLETDLRWALERQEMRVHYQPEIDLRSGTIVGVEALARWEHPRLGLIPPGQFIPVAEETGEIIALGRWILEEACRQAYTRQALRPDAAPITISVNLSPRQFQQPGLVEQVAEVLRDSNLDPATLCLEITESVLMEDTEANLATLRALKALGVRLAIDDFGTGYSSLSYLTRFVVDTLKIDRSFVSRLGEDDGSAAIVRAVTALAQTLGMDVTAEGIETAEQLSQVQAINCNRGQGYYFAQPASGSSITEALAAERAPTLA